MWMIEEHVRLFPTATSYIKTLSSFVKFNQKIGNAFMTACTEDVQFNPVKLAEKIALKTALPWGTGPKVMVYDGVIPTITGGDPTPACGWNNSFAHNTIEITSIWFESVEYCSDVSREQNAQRLRRTLLHELVHWVREEAKADEEVTIGGVLRGRRQEAGAYFEDLAYGVGNRVCNDDNFLDALGSIPPSGEEKLKSARQSKDWASLARRPMKT